MFSSASCATNKHAKLDVSCVQPQSSTFSVVSSGKHINQVPDDCLNLLFNKRFSLKSMMTTLRLVCRRWKTVVECTFSTQRSLKLIADPVHTRAHPRYANELIRYNLVRDEDLLLKRADRHHDLILPSSWSYQFDPLFFDSLGGLFGNLQHLVLCVQADSLFGDQKELGQMIAQWPHLTRLTLFIDTVDDKPEESDSDESDSDEEVDAVNMDEFFADWPDTFPLYEAINSLSSLKHLDLFGDVMLYCKDVTAQLDKVLPQLEHLSLNSSYGLEDFNLDAFLAKLGSNLKSLRLFHFKISDDILRGNFQRLASNITELRLKKVNKEMFNFICEHFQLLKTLQMHFGAKYYHVVENALDSNFICNLNRLSHLESLSLTHVCINLKSTQVITSSRVRSLQLAKILVEPNKTDGVLFVKTLKQMFPYLEQLDYQFGSPNPFALTQQQTENYLRTQFAHLAKSHFIYGYYAHDLYDDSDSDSDY